MLTTILWTLLVAGQPTAKLAVATAKEMTEVIIAANKALGLESWDTFSDEKPCVDRGGLEGTIKDVSAEATRDCAASALENGFPGLGKSYVLGISMAAIGPITAFTVGINEADGWGSYSCDPKRRCRPLKLSANSKHARRLTERYRKACADARTVWFPDRETACSGQPPAVEPTPEPSRPAAKPPTSKPSTKGTTAPAPWPVKQ
jgi:hypothetical protein